jgi:hypothetical protein
VSKPLPPSYRSYCRALLGHRQTIASSGLICIFVLYCACVNNRGAWLGVKHITVLAKRSKMQNTPCRTPVLKHLSRKTAPWTQNLFLGVLEVTVQCTFTKLQSSGRRGDSRAFIFNTDTVRTHVSLPASSQEMTILHSFYAIKRLSSTTENKKILWARVVQLTSALGYWSKGQCFELDSDHVICPITNNWFDGVSIMWPAAPNMLWCVWA